MKVNPEYVVMSCFTNFMGSTLFLLAIKLLFLYLIYRAFLDVDLFLGRNLLYPHPNVCLQKVLDKSGIKLEEVLDINYLFPNV